MVNIIAKPKVKASGLMDLLEMGIMKTVSEKALAATPVGNATFMSGAIKLALGGVVNSAIKNKHGKLLGGAIVIDGAEDISTALLARIGGGGLLSSGGSGPANNF